MLILGIDLGTTSIAGILLRMPENIVLRKISRQNHAGIRSKEEWKRLQDPAIIVQIAEEIIAELEDVAEGISAIAITAQMHGFLYVDQHGRALSPLYTWQDGRAALPSNEGSAIDVIQWETGHVVPAGYALATHYYNSLHHLVPAEMDAMVSIGGYFGMMLCGTQEAYADPSEAASFGIYDIKARSFDFHAIQKLWGRRDFLPMQVPFFHQCGIYRSDIAVFQSLGDNQASFLGAVGEDEDQILINIGTGGQISGLYQGIPAVSRGIECRPYPRENVHLLAGASLTGGKAFSLLMELFHEILTVFDCHYTLDDVYKRINELPLELYERSLWVEPYFLGTRTDPSLRGAIKNISMENLRVAELVYGFAHGIVLELKALYINQLEELLGKRAIVGAGNGLRKNALIREIINKEFQTSVKIAPQEEASYGAAQYAWRAFAP